MNFRNKKVRVGESKISGNGLFAKTDIKKGETIFIVKGSIVGLLKDDMSNLGGENWLGIAKYMWVATKDDHPFRHINHSCEPNAGISGKVKVVALKDIKKDEEITLDYSITEIDEKWHMNCSCGTNLCRGTIKSIQFLPKNIFDAYLPHIPNFFKKVYDNSNK